MSDGPSRPIASAGRGSEPTPGRWVGVPPVERTRDRRTQILDAALDLFASQGEAATSVRGVCRKTGLNPRYFYESFEDRDALLVALYDREAARLAVRIDAETSAARRSIRAQVRAGIGAVLGHLTEDPRRTAVLVTGARGNPLLAERRRRAKDGLVASAARAGGGGDGSGAVRPAVAVAAAMFGGAMDDLAEAWTDHRLGDDLEAVIDHATDVSIALFRRAGQG